MRACDELGYEPGEAYVIEDSYNGIRAAFAAGMHPVMVPDMLAPDDEMAQKAEAVLDDLTAVWEYICNALGVCVFLEKIIKKVSAYKLLLSYNIDSQ